MNLRLVPFLALLALSTLPLAAAESAPLPPAFSELISIDLKDAKAAEVFPLFAQITGTRFVVPTLGKSLNLRVEGVRVRLALDVLCESLGCRWTYFAPPAERVEVVMRDDLGAPGAKGSRALDEALDLSLEEADGKAVLASIARILEGELALEGAVGGTVTMNLKATPVRQVLDDLCLRLGCRWQLLDGPMVTLRVVKK